MQVILLERVEKLGAMGDTVNVKAGYARNFLLPRGKALRANAENMKKFEAQRAELEARNAAAVALAKTDAEKLDGTSYVLIRQAGESGQLYGSVSTRDIAAAASESGVSVNRNQVVLFDPIKTIGLFRNKAKNVIKLSRILVEEYGGVVPSSRAALQSLPGVGRKTANVVLNMWFGHPAQAVDTHIFRIGNRTGICPGRP